MRWIKPGISLCCYSVGSYLFNFFHHRFLAKQWVLLVSFFIQTAITALAAVVASVGSKDGTDGLTLNVLLPIALVSFQSSGQALAAGMLTYNIFSSVDLKSIHCDLWPDSDLPVVRIAQGNNMALPPLLLLIVGAGCGLLLIRSDIGVGGALWIVSALKLIVIVSCLPWRV